MPGAICLVLLWLVQPRPAGVPTASLSQDENAAGVFQGLSATETPTLPPFVPLETSTPLPDGAIVHVVEPGQTLWSIALSYGVTIDEIRGQNDIPPGSTEIYAGQKLIIRLPGSVTPAGGETTTITISPSPTRTRRPTATRLTPAPRIPKATEAASPTPTPTKASRVPAWLQLDNQTLGLILLGVSGVGIVLLLIFGFLKK